MYEQILDESLGIMLVKIEHALRYPFNNRKAVFGMQSTRYLVRVRLYDLYILCEGFFCKIQCLFLEKLITGICKS